MEPVDFLIRNGEIIDHITNTFGVNDVAIKGSKIYAVGRNLQVAAKDIVDASGCIVTPGLIDLHVHCYEYATPLGMNPDRYCLARGVTTVVDAGSSGASTFPGLRKFIAEKSKTRVLCLLHLASHGLAAAKGAKGGPCGESDTLAILNEEACRESIEKNRDMIRGVKIRVASGVTDQGRTEIEAFRRSLSVSAACKVPLMVHHTQSTIPTQRTKDCEFACPGDLRPGDIYTHTFHNFDVMPSAIVDEKTRKIYPDVLSSRSRGVVFDVGHGQGSFDWDVAEICAHEGFWPDTISTDLHRDNVHGPTYDLPAVMTKFLYLGMPTKSIIKSVTSEPAQALGMTDKIGSLTAGHVADVTILKLEDCDSVLKDSKGSTRKIYKRFAITGVWRNGEKISVQSSLWQ